MAQAFTLADAIPSAQLEAPDLAALITQAVTTRADVQPDAAQQANITRCLKWHRQASATFA